MIASTTKHYVEIYPEKGKYRLQCSCGESLGIEDNSPMAHASAHLHIYKELNLSEQ
jgi:hypothetical protein